MKTVPPLPYSRVPLCDVLLARILMVVREVRMVPYRRAQGKRLVLKRPSISLSMKA